jgi:uroporphyrin-III C-methyltransferase
MTVYLVGAGPGDPGLITARGLELVRSCDVLVYDRLIRDELVAEAPNDALHISRDRFEQGDLSAVLVSLGRRELDVVRLKGGDPFLFGRGGEEALALAEAGVGFEIVPGVSALHAVPAASGIPITHRGLSSQVTIVSGHEPEALDFAALAAAPGTLVVFMGLETLPTLVDRILEAGKASDTPVAVISKGTTAEQESVVSRLDAVAEAAAHLRPPALTVIGDVVALAPALTALHTSPTREPAEVSAR